MTFTFEKEERRGECGAFSAVHERVVLNKGMEQRRGFFEILRIKFAVTERDERSRNG
jgi:hypothetical protein